MANPSFPEIYLDANATTPVWPEAAQEAFAAMEDLYGNPSSSHITGLRARSQLESARLLAQAALGVDSGRIVFTSGATEAIQMAIFSTLCTIREGRTRSDATTAEPRCLLYGATEHKAVPQALNHWNQLLGINNEVVAIPVDREGRLDLEFLREHASRADIVCTMAVNNETGVIHDLAAVEDALSTRSPHLRWMVDCVQAVGKLKLNLADTMIDYAPVSGHKIYGPKGIGFLYVRDEAPIVPLLAGGGQEGGARGGTENLPGVAAIASILKCLNTPQSTNFANQSILESWRDRLVEALRQAFPTIVFNTPFEHAVPTTINFTVEGFSSKEILDLFDAANVRVSSGSACGSAIQGSFVLEAMGLPRWRSDGAVRLSFGPMTPASDIDAAEIRIIEAGRALSASCLMGTSDVEVTSGSVVDGLVQLKKGSACSWVLLDADRQKCVIIDPFEELSERIESLVRCQNSQVVAILDTHNHVDHESCRTALLESLSDCAADSARSSHLLGWPEITDGVVCLDDGTEAEMLRINESLVIARTDLPGHTVDGLAFLVGTTDDADRLTGANIRIAFTGDTIQIGGIGRSDFYSSSVSDLYDSLNRLPKIVGSHTLICPTHDYTSGFATTLFAESNGNPLLRQFALQAPPTLEEFQQAKGIVDSHIDDDANCELVCGHISTAACEKHSIDIRPEDLPEFFAARTDSLIVDVREPHEFRFTQDWTSLGLAQPPRNIPLTRLSNFLSHLLSGSSDGDEQDLIFLCRSGSRSGRAAEVLRRLGRKNVWHIKGGIALGIQRETATQDEMEYMI